MDRFEPFSPTHAAVVITFVALVTSLVTARRRRRTDPARARAFDRAVAAGAFVAFAAANAWPLLPRHFQLDWSLPLHVCDIVTLCAPVAIATDYRPARVLLYFWGLALCTQGLVTPDLQDGPARVGFWTFWLAHFCVVGGAVYDVAGRGYRPTWRDYRLGVFVSLAYVAVILPMDLWLGVNYGYLGRGTPGQPTIVDALGPWPWRVMVMVTLGLAGMALLMLPWEIAFIWRNRRGGFAGTAEERAAGSE